MIDNWVISLSLALSTAAPFWEGLACEAKASSAGGLSSDGPGSRWGVVD